jgi:poly(3-hydroxybutyrate) depolymerase
MPAAGASNATYGTEGLSAGEHSIAVISSGLSRSVLVFVPAAAAPDDVQFIRDTIDQIAAKTCIDSRRVSVAGMSGGGRMTSLLACRLSTRIAAIAPVSGLRAGLPSADNPARPDPATCQPQRAMPIVSFHGTGDAVNPYNGGGAAYWAYSIPTALQRWAELDHCGNKPLEQHIAVHVTLLRYTQCAEGAEIWMYRTDATGEQGGAIEFSGPLPCNEWPIRSSLCDRD